MSIKENFKLDKIEDAIESVSKGEVIIVVDDENRENEGDFIAAAEKITPKNKPHPKQVERLNYQIPKHIVFN